MIKVYIKQCFAYILEKKKPWLGGMVEWGGGGGGGAGGAGGGGGGGGGGQVCLTNRMV
jgi:hypothetical protein